MNTDAPQWCNRTTYIKYIQIFQRDTCRLLIRFGLIRFESTYILVVVFNLSVSIANLGPSLNFICSLLEQALIHEKRTCMHEYTNLFDGLGTKWWVRGKFMIFRCDTARLVEFKAYCSGFGSNRTIFWLPAMLEKTLLSTQTFILLMYCEDP